MTVEELTADRKYVVKWCNALRKTAGVGGTSRLTRGFWARGMDPISQTLWQVGVRAAGAKGDTVYLAGVTKADAPVWPKLKEHVERSRSFEEPVVARFLRAYEAGAYPDLETQAKPVVANRAQVRAEARRQARAAA